MTGGKEIVGADLWPSQPQARESVPPKGYALAPRAEAELQFVVDVTKTGEWGWPQTQLDYKAGGKDYTIRVTAGYYICPKSASDCAQPD